MPYTTLFDEVFQGLAASTPFSSINETDPNEITGQNDL
jgi:hypothetical protein